MLHDCKTEATSTWITNRILKLGVTQKGQRHDACFMGAFPFFTILTPNELFSPTFCLFGVEMKAFAVNSNFALSDSSLCSSSSSLSAFRLTVKLGAGSASSPLVNRESAHCDDFTCSNDNHADDAAGDLLPVCLHLLLAEHRQQETLISPRSTSPLEYSLLLERWLRVSYDEAL